MATLGERLRNERKRLGMTQEEMGKMGGVEKLTQLRYEKDERVPDASYLMALEASSEINLNYLLKSERKSNNRLSDNSQQDIENKKDSKQVKKESFSERLKRFRESKELTVEELAKAIDYASSALTRIESDYFSVPSVLLVLALQKTYQLNANWLLTGEGDVYMQAAAKSSDDEQDLQAVFSKMLESLKTLPIREQHYYEISIRKMAEELEGLANHTKKTD